MRTRPVWLALLMVVMVTSLCLSQRIGLVQLCPLQSAALQAIDEAPAADDGQCHLSEQLLGKSWNPLEPMFIGLLLAITLWLQPALLLLRETGAPPPLPTARRRRHLLLCIFRE